MRCVIRNCESQFTKYVQVPIKSLNGVEDMLDRKTEVALYLCMAHEHTFDK